MIGIDIDLTGYFKAVDAFDGHLYDAMSEAAQRVGEHGVAKGKATIRFRNRTGRLRKSIRSSGPKLSASSASVEVKAGGGRVHYARYVEEGTSRMFPRQYMKMDVEQKTAHVAEKLFGQAIDSALNLSGLGE